MHTSFSDLSSIFSYTTETIDLISRLLQVLVLSCLTAKSFVGRWQIIRIKLIQLQNAISDLSDCAHWSENPLLQELLPNLVKTLDKIQTLSDQCQYPSFKGGKLLMQSDLDMATATLNLQLRDLDLLLRSGVLRVSNAIVLSQPGVGTSKEDITFFIKDIFARLQVGGIEFKKKALDSLLELLKEDEKHSILVAKEGNVELLIQLLDFTCQGSIREQAAFVISLLATGSVSSRKCIFEGGVLGPLLRLIESGTSGAKEKAAMALEAITSDPENAWAISAYSGVSILIEACRSGALPLQVYASGALKNISVVEEIRRTMQEEGVVTVLINLLVSGTDLIQGNAAHCLWILSSSGEEFRISIVKEGGLKVLLQLLQECPNSYTLEFILKTISALSISSSTSRIICASSGFLLKLGEFVKHGSPVLQQISALMICNLPLNEGNKRIMSGCMGSLVKMLETSKPIELQEIASRALVSLLGCGANCKDLSKDEKSMLRLVQMLEPELECMSKGLPISVLSALCDGGNSCRKKIVAAGACQYLQKLVDMEVVSAKKLLQRISGNRLKNIFTLAWRD